MIITCLLALKVSFYFDELLIIVKPETLILNESKGKDKLIETENIFSNT